MSKEVKEVSGSLFDKIYDGAKEVKKAIKKPLIERSMKRQFSQAHDNAQQEIDEAEVAIIAAREELQELDIVALLTLKKKMRKAKELQEEIKAEYKDLFDEDLD